MNNHLKLPDFIGSIFANAILLGPIAMLLFLIFWSVIDPKDMLSVWKLPAVLVIGSVICTFISLSASVVIYGPLVSLALRKQRCATDHFKCFLPVLVAIFPITGSTLLLSDGNHDTIHIAILISAYLTSVLGWYRLSRNIAKKQQQLNSQSK